MTERTTTTEAMTDATTDATTESMRGREVASVDRDDPRMTQPPPATPYPGPAEPERRAAEPERRTAEPDRRRAEQPTNGNGALFGDDDLEKLRGRWRMIQSSFVDDPRSAVKEADSLVDDVMRQLADGFARERKTLEDQWSEGDEVSTEELRLALRRYRSFFDRLLSI
jgi:hypothetical protein